MAYSTKAGYIVWLEKYKWTWFVTLTLRDGIRRKSAKRQFANWIEQLEAWEGAKLSWMRMSEYGGHLKKLHFHVLVAGIKRTPIQAAVDRWRALAGIAEIKRYRPSRGGLSYNLKAMEDSADYDFDASLQNEHLRSRYRRATLAQNGPQSAIAGDLSGRQEVKAVSPSKAIRCAKRVQFASKPAK